MAEEASRSWPDVEVPVDAFAQALVRAVIRDDRDASSELDLGFDHVQVADLYLAVACIAGDVKALRAFEERVLARARPAVERACGRQLAVQDVMQIIREKLLTGPDRRLTRYTGHGALAGWVRVVGVREALMLRRAQRGVPEDDLGAALATHAASSDVEAEALQRRYGGEFKTAVEDAVRQLTTEERNLLRLSVSKGLTIDELAPLFNAHRATMARRLQRVRENVLHSARKLLCDRLGITDDEAASLCRALATEIDVSLVRALDVGADDQP